MWAIVFCGWFVFVALLHSLRLCADPRAMLALSLEAGMLVASIAYLDNASIAESDYSGWVADV